MVDQLLLSGVQFSRTIIGIVTRPYETYRRIVDHGSVWELPYIAAVLAGYFALASLIKTAVFRPFLLTKQFIVLAVAAGATFIFAVVLLWVAGRLVGGKGKLTGVGIAWAYTLVPTTVWFLVTSLLYVLLPPPRTERWQGITFSLLYLVFSVTLFFWKGMLAYLTLRFGLRLDLGKILLVTAVIAPLVGVYSFAMYRFGIFKVPFI